MRLFVNDTGFGAPLAPPTAGIAPPPSQLCTYSSGALYRAKEKPRWIALESNDQLEALVMSLSGYVILWPTCLHVCSTSC